MPENNVYVIENAIRGVLKEAAAGLKSAAATRKMTRRQFLANVLAFPTVEAIPKEESPEQIHTKIALMYENYGVPCPIPLDVLKNRSSEKQADPRVPEVIVAATDITQKKIGEAILTTAYELLGPERSRDYLHTVRFTDGVAAANSSTKSILVMKDFLQVGGNNNSWRRGAGIHELMHLIDLDSGVNILSTLTQMEYVKTQALMVYGPTETYSRTYLNLDGMFAQNYYMVLGRDSVTNAQKGLTLGDEWNKKLRLYAEKNLIGSSLVYQDDGNLTPATIAKFSDQDYLLLGREIMRQVKSDIMGVPQGLRDMITGHYYWNIVAEGWVGLAQDVLMGTGSKISSDPHLNHYVAQYMGLALGGSMEDGPVDMTDLKRRLRYPGTNHVKYKIEAPS